MIASSRPLRFLALVLGGWVALRTYQLWPGVPDPHALIEALAPPADATPAPALARAPPAIATAAPMPLARHHDVPAFVRPRVEIAPLADAPRPKPIVAPGFVSPGTQHPPRTAAPVPIAGSPLVTAPPGRSRLAGSAWLIVRGGGGGTPFAPQLGGSQMGVRLTYALDAARRLSLAGRLSAALGSRQREAAIGLDWQPTALPVHLVVEQRIGIEQARGGPSLGVIAGLGPRPIGRIASVEGYVQAGAIARDGVEGYVDGSLRATREVATLGRTRLDLGLAAWGAAQRGAGRLDAGPVAGLTVPALAGRALRLSLEWRQRLAGDARPASGPALTLGTDF